MLSDSWQTFKQNTGESILKFHAFKRLQAFTNSGIALLTTCENKYKNIYLL